MKKLLIAGLVSSLLVGCGGGEGEINLGNAIPPASEGGNLPDIGVDYLPPLPTEPCLDGSCLEDDGFTNPNLPLTPVEPAPVYPTTPCEDGMECMDDGFTNPNLPTVVDQISEILNWDYSEMEFVCNSNEIECKVSEEGIPHFTVSTYDGVTDYYPLTSIAKGMGYKESKAFQESSFKLEHNSSSAKDTCNLHSTDGKNLLATYGDYKLSLAELESESIDNYGLSWACYYVETSDTTGAEYNHSWFFAKPHPVLSFEEKKALFRILFETAKNQM